jgi:hypothetical protein
MALGFALWGFTIPFTILAVFGHWNQSEAQTEEQSDSSSLEAQRVIINPEGKD